MNDSNCLDLALLLQVVNIQLALCLAHFQSQRPRHCLVHENHTCSFSRNCQYLGTKASQQKMKQSDVRFWLLNNDITFQELIFKSVYFFFGEEREKEHDALVLGKGLR
jgi:hypothetical protein